VKKRIKGVERVPMSYIAVKEGTEHSELTNKQSSTISLITNNLQKKNKSLCISFPGDEEKFGGCLSAGRGFLHISPEGRIEPCPFAPYSDCNLKEISLKEALQSKLLKLIRDNHSELTETHGGCTLWEKKNWVRSLLSNKTD